jgi:hypothetical protein
LRVDRGQKFGATKAQAQFASFNFPNNLIADPSQAHATGYATDVQPDVNDRRQIR